VIGLLAIIALVALIPLTGCATGAYWGPGILGVAFLLPALMLFMGRSTGGAVLGLLCLVAAIVELSAANEYWSRRNTAAGPSRAWRALAIVVGLAGSALLVLIVYALLVFLAWLTMIS
jgi:uncharacterized membrane protein